MLNKLNKTDSNTWLDLIPGQYSLSKDGTGKINLVGVLVGSSPPLANLESSVPALALSDEEFLRVRFRALSQIFIEGYCIDFSTPGVLEKSVPLLKNQTVYTDHKTSVHNWIGTVENSFWDEKSIPPGIDVDLRIDRALNPKIVRGLTLQPPAIHSCSVTTKFTWHKSHPELSDDDFWELLGTEKDGEVVRVIVDQILMYDELSLVYQGADPNAKKKLMSSLKRLSRSVPDTDDNEGGQLMTELEIKTLQEQLAKAQADFQTLQKTNQTTVQELEASKPLAELGKTYLNELRDSVTSLYRLLKSDKADTQFIEKMITNASPENLAILKKEYQTELSTKAAFTCPRCGKSITGLRASQATPLPAEPAPSITEASQYKV